MIREIVLDTETTGLDPTQHQVIEVGSIIYSIEHRTVMSQFSTLLRCDGNPCEHINRIPAAALAGLQEGSAEECIRGLLPPCDVIVAHNADFDAAFFAMSPREALVTDPQRKTW